MTDLSRIGMLTIGGETEVGSAAGVAAYVRCFPIDFGSVTRELLDDEHMRQGDYEVQKVVGPVRGTLVTEHYLHGYNGSLPTAAPSITRATQGGATAWDMIMDSLASAIGGITAGGFINSVTLGGTGSPVDTLTCTDAGAGLSSFEAGQAVAWATGNSDIPYEVGWLTSIDEGATPDEAGLLQTPDVTPQGTVLYGAYTLFDKTGDAYHDYTNAAASFTLIFVGHNGRRFRVYGARISGYKITITVGGAPKIQLTWMYADVIEDTTTAPSIQSWSYPQWEMVSYWHFRWGASTPRELQTKEITIEGGLTLETIEGGYSVNGIEDYYMAMRRPRISAMLLRSFANEVTDFANQSAAPLTLQIGTQPGKMFAACMPNARLDVDPTPKEDRSAVRADMVWRADVYTDDTGTVADTSPIDTRYRCAWL